MVWDSVKIAACAVFALGMWGWTMSTVSAGTPERSDGSGASLYDLTVKDIDGHDVKLSRYKGDALLIVNVASQ